MTGTDVDYLQSPVADNNGVFFNSQECDNSLPQNADANGAYNIARKALWAISVLKETDDELVKSADLSIKNSDWLEFVQK
jgi:CRISPR-associated protein Cpf1